MLPPLNRAETACAGPILTGFVCLFLLTACACPARADDVPASPESQARDLAAEVLRNAGDGDLGEWTRSILDRALKRAGEAARQTVPDRSGETSPLPAERHAGELSGPRAGTAEILIFTSLSVPAASWRQWAREAASIGNFEITGGGYVVTGRDEEAIRRGMDEVKVRLGFYGSTPDYWPILEMHGYGDLGRKLRQMTREGKWGELAGEIPDDLVRLFAAVGVHSEIKDAIETRFGNGVDTLYAGMLPTADRDLPPDLIQDIQQIPVAFEGFAERG